MKTAEQLFASLLGKDEPLTAPSNYDLECYKKIEQFALDCAKWGAEQAANTIDVTEPSAPSVRKQTILTFASNLTINDLPK